MKRNTKLSGVFYFIMIGIYKITNPKGKIYIGQSINIEKRFRAYKNTDCKNQPKLYNSFIKYGVDKHKFEIIQLCNIEKLNELEKYYVDLFQTFNNSNGLNLRDGGGSKGITSNITKEKQRISATGKVMSLDARKKMSEYRKGTKRTIESIKKGIASNTGKKRTDETKIKMSNWIRTDEMRKKLSKSNLGKKMSKSACNKMSESRKKIILNTQTGIFYFGVSDAHSSEKKLSKGMLYHKLNGHKFNNTNFLYV